MSKPTITPALKVAALLHRVYMQFGVYLKDAVSGEDMTPDDRIQFDHVHCTKLGGPNVYDNIRPLLVKPHQKKTKADLRMIKKTRPGHASKFVVRKAERACKTCGSPHCPTVRPERPKRKWAKGRKLQSRPFQKKEKDRGAKNHAA